MKNNQTHLCSLLNTIPKENHVVMGRQYLMDLVNANLPSLLQDENLRAKETDVR